MDIIRLVEQCKAGDRESFGILYKTFLPAMREVVAYYIHNPDAVWDVIHDGFIIAFASIDTLRDGSKVEAWLKTIMKNLSLQYVREESCRISVPISDTVITDDISATIDEVPELTWKELDKIIDQLPKGYNKVFRLAVLDGLSHKEIAAQLGIAPHSSSSQLAHAKAMLRRMIKRYRMEMGILSVIGLMWLIWHGHYKHNVDGHSAPIICNNADAKPTVFIDSITDIGSSIDSIMPKPIIIHNIIRHHEKKQSIADATISNDSITVINMDSISHDTIKVAPNAINKAELIANKDVPNKNRNKKNNDWSLSLAYTGSLEHNDMNRYAIPNPDAPSVEGPSDEIEVIEKTHNFMPVVIGLYVNKPITSHWSVEAGLQYTYLRSDYFTESELEEKETIQRIHYMGVPVKFNYRIVTSNGFSMYGHGGGALDIPVCGTQSKVEHLRKLGVTNKGISRIHAPLQWSAMVGLGIQYYITPSLSIYAEPSLRYYFNPGSDIKTIRQETPFEFTIPIGLRLTW